MFEELTAFLPTLQESSFGEWIIDREHGIDKGASAMVN